VGLLGTKLAAEQMAKTSGGSIVNISSIMGFVGEASGHPAYSASKGAVRIYAKSAGGALPAEVPDSASPSRLEPGPLLAIQANGR
jgi:NAD(P)-dependent dehydrogenase (short-subunit alcohol dehydrogenase family)